MAAPATTARVTPTGIKLEDGYSSKIAFARKPNVNLWEKTAKPPGYDGGDKIDTTTMHNLAFHTAAARALVMVTDGSFKAAYDPNAYGAAQVGTLINKEGSITHHFPDGSTLDYYGYLKSFEPDEAQNGTMPEATVVICVTNWDPVARSEVGPVLTEVSGT